MNLIGLNKKNVVNYSHLSKIKKEGELFMHNIGLLGDASCQLNFQDMQIK